MVMKMEYLKLDEISKNIAEWVQTDFAKTLFQFDSRMKDFKFVRVTNVPKVWKENDVWIIDALIEYELAGAKKRNVTFQVDSKGTTVGFNLYEPIRG